MIIVNSSMLLFPCSCQNISVATGNISDSGFCEAQTPDWPVYDMVNYIVIIIFAFGLYFCGPDCLLLFSRVVLPAWKVGSSQTSASSWESVLE